MASPQERGVPTGRRLANQKMLAVSRIEIRTDPTNATTRYAPPSK